MKQFDKIIIKSIKQLLREGWEPMAWGWIKNKASTLSEAHREISYYQGIEDILTSDRVLTVGEVDGGHLKYIHCVETDYHVAKEAVLFE